jgi:osmoprotectant transport system permease protein
VTVFTDFYDWVTTRKHWSGSAGITHQTWEHLQYVLLALVIALAVGIPLGLLTGHFRRGGTAVAALVNLARALPTLGILYIMAAYEPFKVAPVVLVLAALALPAILVNTYTGVTEVDPDAVDAARGMGMTPLQVLTRVEVPNALPLIWLGLRLAAFQVVATATIAAFVSLQGYGTYIRFGLADRDYPQVIAGAGLTVILALLSLVVVTILARLTVSKGLRAQS